MNPWDHQPELQRDRLIAIGEMIQRGRNAALDRFDPLVGCDSWTVGCEAFAFQKHEIMQSALSSDWLSILDQSMQFVFCIGKVPVRFYRGEPHEPTSRTLKQSFPELDQLVLFSKEELAKLGSNVLYRFAVETDVDGSLTAITFVVLSGDVPILTWSVPIDDPVSKVTPLWVEPAEGVELPAPIVGVAEPDHADRETGRK